VDVNAYARMLMQLLPRGPLFPRGEGSGLFKLMQGIGEELARVEARGRALIEESDPRTATETLAEWETMLGLPDDAVLEVPSTTEGRRLAIVSKLLRLGGQSRAFFVALAAACGYTATVDDSYGLTVARSGRLRAGDPVRGTEWAHAWMMTVEPPAGVALTHAELERIVRRAAPAHSAVLFTYT
jgi:uncharacterized protein YmfQ (DUF2313 family)